MSTRNWYLAGSLFIESYDFFQMAANDDTRKEWLIGKIMDIFFDSGTDLPEELHAKVVLWLLDEKDAELKEKHMMRKFDEMIGTDDTDIPTPKIQHPV